MGKSKIDRHKGFLPGNKSSWFYRLLRCNGKEVFCFSFHSLDVRWSGKVSAGPKNVKKMDLEFVSSGMIKEKNKKVNHMGVITLNSGVQMSMGGYGGISNP